MITYHTEIDQGSGAWMAMRCGVLTASQVELIVTPSKLMAAANEKERNFLYEIVAQRATGFIEPQYASYDMVRGKQEEILARDLYSEKYAPVTQCGFVTNDKLGFLFGYSPDGLVGDVGQVEIKSRCQKYQMATIVDGKMPSDFLLHVQSGLLATERQWCDFVSYSNGMPMFVHRIHPDAAVIGAISITAKAFEEKVQKRLAEYHERAAQFHPTKRISYEEITA